MALPPDPDQLANKIANWPKWATEESINSLSAAMGRNNGSLLDAVKKTNELLAKQQASSTKDQTAQKAVIGSLEKSAKAQQSNAGAIKSLSTGLNNIAKGQSAVVAAIRRLESKSKAPGAKTTPATGPSAASMSLGNRTLSRAVEVGFKSLTQQQSRANALLKSINSNTSSGLRGATRNTTATQNTNRRTRANENQSERLEEVLGRRHYRPSSHNRLKSKDDERLDPATKRTSESIRATRQDLRRLKPEQRQAAAKIIAADIKATFGAAARKPLEDFQKAVKAAGDDAGKLNKAFKDLDKSIKSADTQYKLRPGEKSGDMFRRNQAANGVGSENIKRILGGDVKGGVMGMVTGMLQSFAGSLMLTFGRFAPAVMAAVAAIGVLAGAAMKLYEVWQEGAQSTIKAFGSGLGGLATTALSFAIAAKTAGLTLEQFNAAVANSGNMAGMLDENIRNSGQRFADGARQYLDSAKKANFYGQNIEQLMQSYSRSVMMVGQAGLTGANAQAAAQRMAEQQASELYRLAQTTGNSVDELNTAFNQLYRNDMFRAAQQRMLAAGEKKASQELETFGKTLAAIGGQFAGQITNELEYAALGGFDPTVIGGAFAKLQTLSSDLGRIMQSEEYRNETDPAKQAAMLQPAAATALQNLRGSPLAVMAATGDGEARGLIDFIRRAAATRTPDQVAQVGASPTGAGADAAAAYIESQRKLQQVQGDLLRAVEPLMPAFTSLQNAINETIGKFLSLTDTTKNLIYAFGAVLALLAAVGLGKGIVGGIRRGAGAAATGLGGLFGGGKGGPTPGPVAPGPGGPTPGGAPAPGTPSATTPPKTTTPAPGTPTATTPPKPSVPGTPVEPVPPRPAAPAPVEPVPPRPATPATPTPTPATVPGEVARPPGVSATPPSAAPEASPAAGTASRMSGVANAARASARVASGGGIIGSLFGVVINEFTSVSELEDLRKQTIEKYRRGEIARPDAEKALKEIDDQIAESRGGSITRGAVGGAGGAIGGLAGGIAGLGVASAPVGIAGAIGGSMLADRLLGGTAERAGGFISRQLFGASNRGINRELNAIQPTPGGQPSAGQTPATTAFNIAGKPVVQGQSLAPDQMAALGMALQMDPRNARNYPVWVMEQYNRQKSQGAVSSVTPGAVGAIAATGVLNQPANTAGAPRTGNVQTPSGSTGVGSATSSAVTALGASSDTSPKDSQQLSEKARVEQTQTDIRTLAEQQAHTNQILTAILGRQDQVAGDSRRTVDVLENLNSKS